MLSSGSCWHRFLCLVGVLFLRAEVWRRAMATDSAKKGSKQSPKPGKDEKERAKAKSGGGLGIARLLLALAVIVVGVAVTMTLRQDDAEDEQMLREWEIDIQYRMGALRWLVESLRRIERFHNEAPEVMTEKDAQCSENGWSKGQCWMSMVSAYVEQSSDEQGRAILDSLSVSTDDPVTHFAVAVSILLAQAQSELHAFVPDHENVNLALAATLSDHIPGTLCSPGTRQGLDGIGEWKDRWRYSMFLHGIEFADVQEFYRSESERLDDAGETAAAYRTAVLHTISRDPAVWQMVGISPDDWDAYIARAEDRLRVECADPDALTGEEDGGEAEEANEHPNGIEEEQDVEKDEEVASGVSDSPSEP